MAPRLAHNAALCNAFVAKHRVTCRYPRVSEQIATLDLERGKLAAYGYNPGLVEWQGELLMPYRYHEGDTLHSSLAVARVTHQGQVLHNQPVTLVNGGEDAKAFTLQGLPYLSWVESTYPLPPFRSVVQYGSYVEGKIERRHLPKLPGNDHSTMQKNWVFFEQDNFAHCIYQCHPDQVTYMLQGEELIAQYVTEGPRWAYGQIRGGTTPIPWCGNLLRFFHSGLDNEFGIYRRRYFLGAYLMKATPPFQVLAVSRRPIVYGSELDGLKSADRAKCPQYKRQVVFPGGAVEVGNEFLVACGVNDSACEILRVTADDLHL